MVTLRTQSDHSLSTVKLLDHLHHHPPPPLPTSTTYTRSPTQAEQAASWGSYHALHPIEPSIHHHHHHAITTLHHHHLIIAISKLERPVSHYHHAPGTAYPPPYQHGTEA